MAVWLAALARRTAAGTATNFPRRLVWVVDRRVVVDQATDEALAIRSNLAEATSPAANFLRLALADLSGGHPAPLGISTLRGEREDNEEWSSQPARAAIVVGTVDMIGSRLLFSGYGDGPYWAAQHAGLLGQDCLIVNDEAHLTPAFAALLRRIEAMQGANTLKPFRTIRLSATHGAANCWPASLADDETDPKFARPFTARKRLHIHDCPANTLDSHILRLACDSETPSRVLIYVEAPEKAAELARAIEARTRRPDRIATLTGTMRGHERDCLVRGNIYREFAGSAQPGSRCWLISTSAGEVGANISSDLLITEISELDHLLQRFGRCNRFGEGDAEIHVLAPGKAARGQAEKDRQARFEAARKFLEGLPEDSATARDASPAALFGRNLPPEACSPAPLFAPLYDWQIANLSQTSLGKHPARPPVERWLHGKQENLPETFLAWRNDVPWLTRDCVDSADLEVLLRRRPVLAHERLREPTYRLKEKLATLSKAAGSGTRFLLRSPDGTVGSHPLTDLENLDLDYCLVLLPPGCGTIHNGMLSPELEKETPSATAFDVSWGSCLLATQREDGDWALSTVAGKPTPTESLGQLTPASLRGLADAIGTRFVLDLSLGEPENADTARQRLLSFTQPGAQASRDTDAEYPLADHLRDVAASARSIAHRAGLSPSLVESFALAGAAHDLGKDAPIWQAAIGNASAVALAKPRRTMDGRSLGGYRHELGSLLDAISLDLPAAERELILHLIASHHKAARPSFRKNALDRRSLTRSHEAALSAPGRFAILHRQFGPWGLAYLEALLRAADAQCSQPHSSAEGAGA